MRRSYNYEKKSDSLLVDSQQSSKTSEDLSRKLLPLNNLLDKTLSSDLPVALEMARELTSPTRRSSVLLTGDDTNCSVAILINAKPLKDYQEPPIKRESSSSSSNSRKGSSGSSEMRSEDTAATLNESGVAPSATQNRNGGSTEALPREGRGRGRAEREKTLEKMRKVYRRPSLAEAQDSLMAIPSNSEEQESKQEDDYPSSKQRKKKRVPATLIIPLLKSIAAEEEAPVPVSSSELSTTPPNRSLGKNSL